MRTNFLALVLCLMLGTAGMPHILMRSYTTPSVSEARRSVCWSLLFILLLYFMAPALALLVKYEVYTQVVGSNFLSLPNWVHAWSAVDSNLLDVTDINRDGIVQLGEISMGADVVVLAMPEIGGLPYVISGLVAAGGLAAALSTADGLLLTLSNSLSHDMWYRVVSPRMPAARRDGVQDPAAGGGVRRGLGRGAQAGRHPVHGVRRLLLRRLVFLPGIGHGRVLAASEQVGATLGMAAGLLVTFS